MILNDLTKLSGYKNIKIITSGSKLVQSSISGAQNIYTSLVGTISTFAKKNILTITAKIGSSVGITFHKKVDFFIEQLINNSQNLRLVLSRRISASATISSNIVVDNLIKNINMQINAILALNASQPNMEVLRNVLNARIKVESNIDAQFVKNVSLFINLFYDTHGKLNFNAVKQYAINSNINVNTLMTMIKETQLGINNLIDINITNGADFKVAKTMAITSSNHIGVTVNITALRLNINNMYLNETLSTMFDSTLVDLIQTTY